MNEALLAICIPTYNRAAQLKKRLNELVPQLSCSVVLHIYDNGSTDETQQVVEQIDSPFLYYHRSKSNLGMSANISRCFTETEAKWMWMLGDDDRVKSDAIGICRNIIQKTNADIINTVSLACANPVEIVVSTIEELLNYKNPTDLMHISSNIYRIKSLRDSFKILAPAGITMAPHLVLILHAFQYINIKMELVSVGLLDEIPNHKRYSSMELAIGMSAIPTYLPTYLRKRIAKSLRESTRWMLLWSLVEIKTSENADQWKISSKLVDGIFALHGATFFSQAPKIFKKRDSRRDLSIQIIKLIPNFLLKRIAMIQYIKNKDKVDYISYELK